MKIHDGYIIYMVTSTNETRFFCGRPANQLRPNETWTKPAGKTYSDSQKWELNHSKATTFDEINARLVQTVRLLRQIEETDNIFVGNKHTEIEELDFDKGDLYKERVEQALGKLETDEIQLLGLGKLAVEYKLRS